jgi:hypothetical protein
MRRQDQGLEGRVRERAIRQGYRLRKLRPPIHSHNHGLYQLIDVRRNAIVMGERYNASLQHIERYLLAMKQKRSHIGIPLTAQVPTKGGGGPAKSARLHKGYS